MSRPSIEDIDKVKAGDRVILIKDVQCSGIDIPKDSIGTIVVLGFTTAAIRFDLDMYNVSGYYLNVKSAALFIRDLALLESLPILPKGNMQPINKEEENNTLWNSIIDYSKA